MERRTLTSAILGGLLVALLPAVAAQAQATRTWVSGVGDDANPCSRTAPCKTFAGAISKTAAGGEINVLDPGGFGAVTITKSITIRSDHIEAGVLVSGTNGIVVSAGPTDEVRLEGLDIEGLGTGLSGVVVNSGLLVTIDRCLIHKFTTTGVKVTSSTANTRVVINNSQIFSNGTLNVANTGGVFVQGNGVGNVAQIMDTLIQNNVNFGVQVNGSTNNVAFIRTIVTPTGISSVSSGNLVSLGPSNVFATGAPTQAVINFQ